MHGHGEIIDRLERIEKLLEEQRQRKPRPNIDEWCEAHDISRSYFYKLKLPFAKSGSRSITTAETDEAWEHHLAQTEGAR